MIVLTSTDAEQIELTREVLAIQSYSEAQNLIEGLEPVQWERQQADNDLWEANKNETDAIKRVGSIEFFEPGSLLTGIRNRSRFRFGLPALSGDATEADAQNGLNILTITGLWF